MKKVLIPAVICFQASLALAVDFKTQIAPVLKEHCYKCHSEEAKKEKGKLVLDNLTRLGEKVGPSKIIKPGDAEKSGFFTSLTSPVDDDDHMPPKKQMPEAQVALIKEWIAGGASLGADATAPATPAPAMAPATPAAPTAPATVQSWTSTDGRTIQATMLRMEGENVVLQRADGQTFNIPLSRFSAESQELAKRGGK